MSYLSHPELKGWFLVKCLATLCKDFRFDFLLLNLLTGQWLVLEGATHMANFYCDIAKVLTTEVYDDIEERSKIFLETNHWLFDPSKMFARGTLLKFYICAYVNACKYCVYHINRSQNTTRL